MPDPVSPDSPSPTGRVAAMLALFSLPLSLLGIGGILGLIAIAMASRSSVRNANQRQAFATVIIGFVSVLLGGLVASSWMIGPGRYEGPSPIGTIQTGRVTTLDGETFDLAGGDDRVTLVDVWATWCPPCIASIPMLEAIHRDLGDEVRVIGLSGESARTVRGWLERRTAEVRAGTLEPSAVPTYPIAAGMEPLPDLVRATQAYPTMYLLGPDGDVRQRLVGLHDLPTVLAAIRASEDEPEDAVRTESKDEDGSTPSPLGGCVIERRDGEVPSDLRLHTEILRDDRYAPFTKHLTSGGVVFIATDDVEDSFMTAVGDLHAAMFDPTAPGIDRGLQDAVLTSMFEARTAIPMWKGEDPDFPNQDDWSAFDRLTDRLSICDAIFQLDPRDRASQPMEVVEHLLHHLNMVGLHEVFPDDWGITTESTLHRSMRKALEESWYVVDYLDEFDDEEEAERVLLQEYSYWVISTEWDLQRPFGPDAENGEWNLSDPERFRSLQPELHEAFDRTIPSVLTPPNRAALAAFAE